MSEPGTGGGDREAASTDAGEQAEDPAGEGGSEQTAAELREQVEEKYDFEEFGPRDMAEMTAEEWEAVFDADTWITGPELLDRVERDLAARVERRDVFAVAEREPDPEGSGERIVAYSDEGYAVVREDGTVAGEGTVLRDVKSTVALCSMEEYEVPEVVGDGELPRPGEVTEAGSNLGNTVMQAVGVVQLLAGAGLFAAWVLGAVGVVDPLPVFVPVVALAFLVFGVFVLVLVANARLSDSFRAQEYRERLEAARVGSDDRPEFVPDRTDGREPPNGE